MGVIISRKCAELKHEWTTDDVKDVIRPAVHLLANDVKFTRLA